MDLKYIRENDIYEKYLLNQLSPGKKAEFENFLKENPQALDEFEKTKNLISGIRSSGHDSMRREIEEQVREIKNPKTDWTILYRAAAVLFLFAILPAVVYYNVYVLDVQQPSEEHLMIDGYKEMKKQTIPLQEGSEAHRDKDVPARAEKQISEKTKLPLSAEKASPKVAPVLPSSSKETESAAESILGAGQGVSSVLSSGGQTSGNREISEKLDSPLLKAAESDVISDQSINLESEELGMSARSEALINNVELRESSKKSARNTKLNRLLSADDKQQMAPIAQSKKPKVFRLTQYGKNLSINLVHSFVSTTMDSLIVRVSKDSLNYFVELEVPANLFIISENKILMKWDKNLVEVNFNDEFLYQFRLNLNEKYAYKIK